MVSKYDLLYSLFLNEGLTTAQLVKKLGKTSAEYPNFLHHIKQLETEGLIEAKKKQYFLKNQIRDKNLIRVIDFCVRNKIDYNELFLDKTIEFIECGLKGKSLSELSLNSKTISRISNFLSKHGFLLIESKKPFSARIVYSNILQKTAELFKGKIKIKCKEIFENVNEKEIDSKIETEFSKFKKSNKPINPNDETSFIYRSLSLEGNTLTLPETEKLIKENIPPKNKSFKDMQETMNYKTALDILLADQVELNKERVLSFHKMAMSALQTGAGEFRTQQVKIRGNPDYKTADWHEIPQRIDELFKYYKENISKKMKPHNAIELASYLHAEFQRIHPFVDGNSRTSRAIFAHTLILKGFPLIISPAGFIYQYMELTKLSKERNDKNLEVFMKQLVLHSLKQINQKIKFS